MLIDPGIDRGRARMRGEGGDGRGRGEGERRKPGIVVDCARQLESNNGPPFLAKRRVVSIVSGS